MPQSSAGGASQPSLRDGVDLGLQTEDDLALQWVSTYGDAYRWTPGLDWMTCQPGGDRWHRDHRLERYDDARNLARLASLSTTKPAEQRALGSAKTVHNIVTLARSDRRIALPAEAWNADAYALNTPAGIVDLRDGNVRPRRTIDYVTHCTAVAPAAESVCPVWSKFLADVFLGDETIIEFIQRFVGYTLTADRREQVLLFCYGLGANGKSTFWDLVLGLVGTYAMKLPAQVLMQSQTQGHPTELAQLHGRRLAVSSELEEGQYWAEARIKELTGDEMLRARYMRQDFFEFPMTQKHVIVGNFKPRLKGGDQALARRMLLLPFRARFAGEKRDHRMVERLRAEAPAVLRWAIEGAVKWHAGGLAIPASVRDASAEYMHDNDDLLLWIDEHCIVDAAARSKATPLYEDYIKWLKARGQQAPSMKLWGDRMAALEGVAKLKSHGVKVYTGIGLKALEAPQ